MQDMAHEAISLGDHAVDAGRPGPPVPLRGPGRAKPHCGPLGDSDEKAQRAGRRMRDRQDDYLRFTTDFGASPDNNGSERDTRMAKLKQEGSGCLHTMTGADQFCAIRSHLSTAVKHGLSQIDALVMLAEGGPRIPVVA
jgi:Transposase IS66 family